MKQLKSLQFYILLFILLFLSSVLLSINLSNNLTYDSYSILNSVKHTLDFTNSKNYVVGQTSFKNSYLYSYLIALLSLIISPEILIRILPILFSFFNVILIYLISFNFSNNKNIGFLTSLLSLLVPSFFYKNTIPSSTGHIVLFILLLIIYQIYILEKQYSIKQSNIFKLLLLFILLILSGPISGLFIFGYFIYNLIYLSKRGVITGLESISFFSILFYIWFNLILFKTQFLEFGFNIIKQNIPVSIASSFFLDFKLLYLVNSIGFFIIIIAVYAVYNNYFYKQNKFTNLLIILSLVSLIFISFKLIVYSQGIMFLSVYFLLLFSKGYKAILGKLNEFKYDKIKYFLLIILFLFIMIALFNNFKLILDEYNSYVPDRTLDALNYLKNTNKTGNILTNLNEGYLASYILNQGVLLNKDYLYFNNLDERLVDMDRIYETSLTRIAISKLQKYSLNYILLSKDTQEKYNISKLRYENDKCIDLIYSNVDKIYEVKCKLE